MARYRLNSPAFFQTVKVTQPLPPPAPQLRGMLADYYAEAGTEIEVADTFAPGDHMDPLDDPARKSFAKWEKDKAEAEIRNSKVRAAALEGMMPMGAVHMLPN